MARTLEKAKEVIQDLAMDLSRIQFQNRQDASQLRILVAGLEGLADGLVKHLDMPGVAGDLRQTAQKLQAMAERLDSGKTYSGKMDSGKAVQS